VVIRRIFTLQANGSIADSMRSTADLRDPLLLGSLLADRYLHRYYRAKVPELLSWLEQYRDQSDAPAIHALLLSRLPKGTVPPAAPDVAALSRLSALELAPAETSVDRNRRPEAAALDRAVIGRVQRGATAQALRLIVSISGPSSASAARLRAEVAQVLFTRNEDADALRVIEDSIKDTAPGDQNSLTYYIGGLAAWRMGRVEQSRRLFESAAQAAISSPRLRAASAFWASRANRRLHYTVAGIKWLRRAAEERITFHGILARRILRMDIGIVPRGELLTDANVDAVAAAPQGRRAFALLQIGQSDRAEAELRALWPRIQGSPTFGRSVLMVASAAGLSNFASQLAGLLQVGDRHRFDELRFPIPHLRPFGGFRVDPALVYALTRTESNFDSGATSPGGARGLMQIMPATAHYIAADLAAAEDRLHDPAFNLEIGQRYVTYLARLDSVDNDLIRLLASYNAGPGSVLRWNENVQDEDDPLMFIEAIPVAETRAFVPDVLAASWIYAARLHRPSSSLDSLAAGEFPRFTPLVRESRIAEIALR